ncbi:GNAT family N-acetyltransferase [Corallococcus exiguus]|uniref:GNAT family N-acetyltransferase n=1 Tax=Corallococcus exiguus TaxID=83462 RepID=UPI0014716216|nr:GNAT family N-acetyltransferase [Corallococcus exiguus]NNC20794.1 GNAT family N-acetyltransferase [Corallococcus exiguus]NRD68121.1 GNAT family N-acetyltransferase [Corallococcus exiguus]
MNPVAPWRAVLVPDGGQRAVSSDYFRSEQHLRAEGVTHSLIVEDGEGRALRVPLIVRPIEGTHYRDAVSPYGFPGAELNGLSEVPVDGIDWRGTELVSIFLRDRIGGPYCFAGGRLRTEVCLIDPKLPVKFRSDHGADIRRNARRGYVSAAVPVKDSTQEQREALKSIYRQTMDRNQAGERYYFSEAWFEEVFTCPFAWLVTTHAPDGAVASSALVVLSDGLLHNFIGGTADAYLVHSPAKNEFPVMVELAEKLDASVHLGGGVRPGDGIERFKRGFANAMSQFYTHDLICDPEAYAQLSQGHAGEDFFPAYRAPRS